MLKTALPMESICRILSYVNGQLDDESDDIIDDSVMYLIFSPPGRAANRDTWPPRGLQETLDAVLSGYQEPCPGARHRVADALEVMLTAWFSSQLQKQAAEQNAAAGHLIQQHIHFEKKGDMHMENGTYHWTPDGGDGEKVPPQEAQRKASW